MSETLNIRSRGDSLYLYVRWVLGPKWGWISSTLIALGISRKQVRRIDCLVLLSRVKVHVLDTENKSIFEARERFLRSESCDQHRNDEQMFCLSVALRQLSMPIFVDDNESTALSVSFLSFRWRMIIQSFSPVACAIVIAVIPQGCTQYL